MLLKDPSANFRETALPHVDAVYRFALHLSGNEADAQDLTQDCFHQAFRKFHQFENGTNCRAWLFRIARNAHIDRLRRRGREPLSVELDDVPVTSAPDRLPESDPLDRWRHVAIDETQVFSDGFGDEVNRFLAELPPSFRLALMLCDVEELSYQEIAETLDCPIGTVRSRIARARAHLRDRLYGYAEELGFVKDGVE